MDKKKVCSVCVKEVSSSNWRKHLKSKRHQDQVRRQTDRQLHCWICDMVVDRNDWLDHLNSSSHNRNTKILRDNLLKKDKGVSSARTNKRKFETHYFETDQYIVEKSEEALEGCFLTLRVTPKREIGSVLVIKEELPQLMEEKLQKI